MKIAVNRDSVCMGDDCEDHQKTIEVNGNLKISEFLFFLSDYVPHMRNVIWAVQSDIGICGYIITDDNAIASVDLYKKDISVKDSGIQEVMCLYFYPSKFSYMNGEESGKQINQYPECTTFLEKVKKATGVI